MVRKLTREQAIANGAILRNPKRYADQPEQDDVRNPLLSACPVPNDLNPDERDHFVKAARLWWWLRKTDEQLVRIYCNLAARFDRDELTAPQLGHLIKITSNLGGTPQNRVPESASDLGQSKRTKNLGLD